MTNKSYVILVSRKDGNPFEDGDNFCMFDDPDDTSEKIQISRNKAHVESELISYIDLQSRTYDYILQEVDV